MVLCSCHTLEGHVRHNGSTMESCSTQGFLGEGAGASGREDSTCGETPWLLMHL